MAVNILDIFKQCKLLSKQISEIVDGGSSESSSDSDNFFNEGANGSIKIVPEELLTSLEEQFKKIIYWVESFLMVGNNTVLFGNIMIQLDVKVNMKQDGFIDLNVNTDPITLSLNPLWINNLSLNNVLAEIVKEMAHIIRLHPESYKTLNPMGDDSVHNVLEKSSSVAATEVLLNDMKSLGKDANKISLSDDSYTKNDMELELELPHVPESNQSLEYYKKLIETFSKKEDQSSGNANGNGSSNSNSNGNTSGGTKQVSTPKSNTGNKVHNWESSKSNSEQKMMSVISDAWNSMSNEQRGLVPGGLSQHIEKLLQPPKQNWRQKFAKMIGTVPQGYYKTRRRLNRRQPERFDLFGKLPKKHVRIVMVIDTSGSMSDEMLQFVSVEMFAILKAVTFTVTVIECDAEINRVYEAKSAKDIKLDFNGRGGTSFTPAIEYINENKFKDAVMIYFTDGYGESEIPKPKTYKNMWVIVDDNYSSRSSDGKPYLSVNNPYGEVFALADDDKYKKRKR